MANKIMDKIQNAAGSKVQDVLKGIMPASSSEKDDKSGGLGGLFGGNDSEKMSDIFSKQDKK